MNDRGPRDLALRALRECGIVRASVQHRGMMGLFADFLAELRPIPGRDGVADFYLTPKGAALAAQLKPWSQTR